MPDQSRPSHPHVLLVHELVGGRSGMGRVLRAQAEAVLDGGWALTVVGSEVTASLDARCRVVRVPAWKRLPSLLHYRLWAARAELVVRRLRDEIRPDIVHVHSPALLRVCDVMTCHYLAFSAFRRGVRPDGQGVEASLRRAQAAADRRLDDRTYRRRPPNTYLSFVSTFLRDEFTSRYGEPRGGWVLPPPSPPWRPVDPEARAAARRRWDVPDGRVAVGFFGGNSQLKGVDLVLDLAGNDDGVHVLLAGPRSEQVRWTGGRGLGFVDPDDLLEACDVVLAPSLFDSAPVAVLQSVARGVPVVVSAQCGLAEPLRQHGAGLVLNRPGEASEFVRRASRISRDACRALTDAFAPSQLGGKLLAAYESILADRLTGARRSGASGGAAS